MPFHTVRLCSFVSGMLLTLLVTAGCTLTSQTVTPSATLLPSPTPTLIPLLNEWLYSYLRATPSANTSGLTLVLSLDKTIYRQSEKITSTIIIKNEGSKAVWIDLAPLWPLKYETPGLFPSYCGYPGYQVIGYLMKTPSGDDASDVTIVDDFGLIATKTLQQLAPGGAVTIIDPCVGDGIFRDEQGQYRVQAVYQNRFSTMSDQAVLVIWSNVVAFTSELDE